MPDPTKLNRREFMETAGAALLAVPHSNIVPSSAGPAVTESRPFLGTLPPWQPGLLDIHHIATGRGSSAFLILPDGTTMLIDSGDVSREAHLEEYLVAARPDSSMRPGQWVARYIQRHLAPTKNDGLDYFVLTHLHNDHMGANTPSKPMSTKGNYRLSGVSDVAEVLAIRRILDRAYPDYAYPVPLDDIHQQNYRAYVRSAEARGVSVQRFRPGHIDQIRLQRSPAAYPEFAVRNLAANGEVWTGFGDATRQLFPAITSLTKEQYPDENMCSLAFKLTYGAFSYYTGGDLTGDTNYGRDGWRDVEVPVAQAAGKVEVAVANHHGFVNACSPDWVRAIRPRCFVVNAWTSAHPTMTTLDSMFSPLLYPGPREVYSTAVRPESRIAVRRLDEMSGTDGHIVVRVAARGASYQIFVTTNLDESDRIVHQSDAIELS